MERAMKTKLMLAAAFGLTMALGGLDRAQQAAPKPAGVAVTGSDRERC